jgi:hypothetical protein
MIRRINANYILKNETSTEEQMMIEANILGYPYYKYKDSYYIIRANRKGTKLKSLLVSDEIIEI